MSPSGQATGPTKDLLLLRADSALYAAKPGSDRQRLAAMAGSHRSAQDVAGFDSDLETSSVAGFARRQLGDGCGPGR